MPEEPLHIKLRGFKDLIETDLELCQAFDIQEAGKLLLNCALLSHCLLKKNNRTEQMRNLERALIYHFSSVWSELGSITIEMMKAD